MALFFVWAQSRHVSRRLRPHEGQT